MKLIKMIVIIIVIMILLSASAFVIFSAPASATKIESCDLFVVSVLIEKMTKDGCFVYNVTNAGDTDVVNMTFYVEVAGGGGWYSLDTKTSFFVGCLPKHTYGLFKTIDPVFTKKQFPVFHRPLVGRFVETVRLLSSYQRAMIIVMFNLFFEIITV